MMRLRGGGGVLVCTFLLLSTSVRSCPPANIPTFVDTTRTQLRGPVQAIVPSYTFSLKGSVTMWGACIQPGGMTERELYDIYFQVLRAAPQGPEGCYDLVGYNFIERGKGGVDELRRCIVMEDIPPEDQIQVEPGDVVGFRVEHFRNGVLHSGGVQLATNRTDVTVWYLMGRDVVFDDTTDCRFRVGPGTEPGRLVNQTSHPPVITANVLAFPPSSSTSAPQVPTSPSPPPHAPSPSVTVSPPDSPGESPQTSAPSSLNLPSSAPSNLLHLSTTSDYLSFPPPPTPSPSVAVLPDSPGDESENPAFIIGVTAGLIPFFILMLIVAILIVVCFRLRSKSLQEEAELWENQAYGAAISTGPALEENPAYGAAISTGPALEKNPAYGAFEMNGQDHKDPAEPNEYETVEYTYVDVT